ncbi:hypothetical protein [Euzebya tangerina]|uniref:hypothetical protein n=1 Tax=Euzebya tangerina TaxID=591198 RepID=UPI000E3104C7|nr:hypothetical protein [Euzebya tangerina]
MTTARSWSSPDRPDLPPRGRGYLLLVVLAALAVGCVPTVDDQAGDGGADTNTATSDTGTATTPGEGVVVTVDSGSDDSVTDSAAGGGVAPPDLGASTPTQQLLGPPIVELAEVTLDLARRADFLRHTVDRGQPQQDALAALVGVQARLDRAVLDLDDALAEAQSDAVPVAAEDAMTQLMLEARDVAADVQRDVNELDPYIAFDASLENVVTAWAARGSRSDFETRLEELVVQSDGIAAVARRLPATPDGCTDLRTNRIRWATVVQERTVALRDVAVGGDGTAYDELRDRYDRAPYGEDRTVADAESRVCWLDRTTLPEVPTRVDALLTTIEQTLM